ncbi:hypothetical protein ACFFRR_004615 [Megaselia abdita]
MDPLSVLQILVVFLINSTASVQAKRNYIIQFDGFECSENADLIDSNCSISSNLKKPIISMNFVPKRDLDKIFFNGTIYRKEINDQSKFLNFEKINVCEFLEDKYSHITLMSIFRDMFSRYTNFPSCPFKKDKHFFIKGMKLDAEKFPPMMMDVKLIADTLLFTGDNVKIAAANLTVLVKNKKVKVGK